MAALDDLDQVLTPFREYDLFVVSVEASGVDAPLAHAEREEVGRTRASKSRSLGACRD